MTYLSVKNWDLEVRRGNITGMTKVVINGHNDVMTSTRITIHPSGTTTDIDQSGIHRTGGTPAVVKVASESANDTSGGIGVRTVLLIGLDSSGNAQTETITMNGTTEVTSSNTYSAVNGLRSLTWGSENENFGFLWVGTGTFTGGIPATRYLAMNTAQNIAKTSIYTVPLAKTLYVEKIIMSASTAAIKVQFSIGTSTNGLAFFTDAIFILPESEVQVDLAGLPSVPANSVIRIQCWSDGSTPVSATITSVLIND